MKSAHIYLIDVHGLGENRLLESDDASAADIEVVGCNAAGLYDGVGHRILWDTKYIHRLLLMDAMQRKE
jgi:hypothetical protein